MDSLATEVLVLIFSFLPVSEILSCIKVGDRVNSIQFNLDSPSILAYISIGNNLKL